MPRLRIRSRSSTSHSSPYSGAISRAASAILNGVSRLAGSFTRSRVKFCASASTWPRAPPHRVGGAGRAHHGKRVQRFLVVAGLVAVRLVVAEDGAFHGGRSEFGAVRFALQQHRGRLHLLLLQEAHRRRHQLAQLGGIESSGFPAPASSTRAAASSGGIVQQREFAGLPATSPASTQGAAPKRVPFPLRRPARSVRRRQPVRRDFVRA